MSLQWEAQEKKSQQVGMVNSHVQHEETHGSVLRRT